MTKAEYIEWLDLQIESISKLTNDDARTRGDAFMRGALESMKTAKRQAEKLD